MVPGIAALFVRSLDRLRSFAHQRGLITILGHVNVSDRLPTDAVGSAIGFLRYGTVSHHQVAHLNRPWRFLVSLRGGCSRRGRGGSALRLWPGAAERCCGQDQ